MRLALLSTFLLLLTACATPFVARATVLGDGVAGFDGAMYATGGQGSGEVTVSVKGSELPLYYAAWNGTKLLVGDVDEDWSEEYGPGEALSDRAKAVTYVVLSAVQLDVLRAVGMDV